MTLCGMVNCKNSADVKPGACFCSTFVPAVPRLLKFTTGVCQFISSEDITATWNFSLAKLNLPAEIKSLLRQDDFLEFLKKFQDPQEPAVSKFYNHLLKQGLCNECFQRHFAKESEEPVAKKRTRSSAKGDHAPTDSPRCFFCKQMWPCTRLPLKDVHHNLLNKILEEFKADIFAIAKRRLEVLVYCDESNFFILKQFNSAIWHVVNYNECSSVENHDDEPMKIEYVPTSLRIYNNWFTLKKKTDMNNLIAVQFSSNQMVTVKINTAGNFENCRGIGGQVVCDVNNLLRPCEEDDEDESSNVVCF